MQKYNNISHVIIDGASTDSTLDVIKSSQSSNQQIISEPDRGIYDALNKGIELADGDIIGLLHSDDVFADDAVIQDVVAAFSDQKVQLVYGDLVYVKSNDTSKIIRYWKAGHFSDLNLKHGWMPPHPTIFVRRSVFNSLGMYDTRYKISADYDAILRFLTTGIDCTYIPRVLVKMRVGGVSNSGINNLLVKMKEDYVIIKKNKIGGFITLIMKNLLKIKQFL